MPDQLPSRMVVSVSEMARMVGLSRQRFHQLRGTAFPEPDYDADIFNEHSDKKGSAGITKQNRLFSSLSDHQKQRHIDQSLIAQR